MGSLLWGWSRWTLEDLLQFYRLRDISDALASKIGPNHFHFRKVCFEGTSDAELAREVTRPALEHQTRGENHEVGWARPVKWLFFTWFVCRP